MSIKIDTLHPNVNEQGGADVQETADDRVVIIGAGMGGLSAALRLVAAGRRVLVLEAAATPGGKLRQVLAGGQPHDAGPTVLTMKWVFDDLLAAFGRRLEDLVPLEQADVLARHYWPDGSHLDLHADAEETGRAVASFAGRREAEGFRRFAADSRKVFELLRPSFIEASRPNPVSLSHRIGWSRPADLLALRPFSSLWSALGQYFADPRLRQLFGRYATYCGSSPFRAPATLMLVAHVEQQGVFVPAGGMHALARALADLARDAGVVLRPASPVARILADAAVAKVRGVQLDTGEVISASAVVYTGDVAALGALLGRPRQPASARSERRRSLSALVACGPARAVGVPLAHHTVFFSADYAAEFEAIFRKRRPPEDPTVYVCALDRSAAGGARARADGAGEGAGPAGATDLLSGTSVPGAGGDARALLRPERIYCLMNMPADADRHRYTDRELGECLTAMDHRLAANGLTLDRRPEALVLSGPDSFARLAPHTGGAIYGQASHGWMASFTRPAARGPLQGLYLAGGSVHPGPGVPMAILSGKLAAQSLIADLSSTGRFRRAAMPGGTSTPPATADVLPSP
ncbi:phytoene desaturase family protein [Pannonibacter tanglangensis]|uniref:Phytoene desaturase n=1 Tax=Pannonibacter tanglangensis TaxID=2750084 RepID=A0ABW9ZGH0_9HYPH|nr:phytoene desaturase family protein [Pannonibacter sp. XCT-34]NBN63133.1 phytoene desaturase [Pannonibacter sp. XCT-34]